MFDGQLTSTSVISRSNELVSSDIDGEIVMMSIENGKYYSLDRVGSRIWEILAEPLLVSALVDCLLQEFEVTRETCENDVMNFLGKLRKDNMLEVFPRS